MSLASTSAKETGSTKHRLWVRICHWVVAISTLILVLSGTFVLSTHPRLYWGEVGNDLTPAWLEFPLSDNHRPDGFEQTVTFTEIPGNPISADRTYGIFNPNGWARSLHFLAAWIAVMGGAAYILLGAFSGHTRRNIFPKLSEIGPRALWTDAVAHLRGQASSGHPYGYTQKLLYALVIYLAAPLMLLTGLTMSPAVTAAWPALLDVFGGYQTARSIHFIVFSCLCLFILVHGAMIVVTGFKEQMRAMLTGK